MKTDERFVQIENSICPGLYTYLHFHLPPVLPKADPDCLFMELLQSVGACCLPVCAGSVDSFWSSLARELQGRSGVSIDDPANSPGSESLMFRAVLSCQGHLSGHHKAGSPSRNPRGDTAVDPCFPKATKSDADSCRMGTFENASTHSRPFQKWLKNTSVRRFR
jgi:hypothetical protein